MDSDSIQFKCVIYKNIDNSKVITDIVYDVTSDSDFNESEKRRNSSNEIQIKMSV